MQRAAFAFTFGFVLGLSLDGIPADADPDTGSLTPDCFDSRRLSNG